MSDLKVFHRERCRVCGGTNLRRWVHLPAMPLTDDLRLPGEVRGEFLFDIDVFYCTECHTSQILHDIDYGGYYLDYSFTVAESPFAAGFMSRLAKEVFAQYRLPVGCTVVEIGSGDGAQLSRFKELGAKVFGYEPSEVLCRASESAGVPVYQGLFDEYSLIHIPGEYRPADVLLLTYTFDHIPEPVKFLETAGRLLNPETGLLIMEVHDLEKIMERREYCLFEHEHSVYLSVRTMQEVLARSGFCLLSTDLLTEGERRGNSLLVVAAKFTSVYSGRALPPQKAGCSDDWSNYEAFNLEMDKGIDRLDAFVDEQSSKGKRIAGYGAGGRGVMTLAAMRSSSKFKYLCDKNPAFHGRQTPKTHIPVVAPSQLSHDPVDILLVFSFGYFDEIREQVALLPNAPSRIVSLLEIL